MRKIYAFLAAVLMSASLFATPTQVPTVADLMNAGYDPTTNVVLCCYFDVAPCNDVVLAGSYNEWSDDPAQCVKFEALAGFDGWYVAETMYVEGIQAKPLQLKNNSFSSWDYQAGDINAWIHLGGAEATITAGYSDEANVAYGAAGAYIYEIAYWKKHNNPCVFVPTHKYTILLYSPTICGDFKPGMGGAFNSWGITEMAQDLDEEFEVVYKLIIEDEEGHEFKFRPTDDDDTWSKQMQFYNVEDDSWADGGNISLPVATKDTTLVFDYADDNLYRWAACKNEQVETVIVGLKSPAGAPVAGIEIIGSFGLGWEEGVMMEPNPSTGWFMAYGIEATASDVFKFREAGTWDNEILVWIPANDENPEGKWESMDNIAFGSVWKDDTWKGEPVKLVELDFSNPAEYCWKAAQGIENVVLTEKANKVMVDGIMYIVRDNKMFNVQGTQVR